MKKRLLYVGALLTTGLVNAQQQQDSTAVEQLQEVVVTVTKFELKREHTGKVIYKITPEEIQNSAGKTVVDLLNNLPGIEIKGTNSNTGEIRGTYIRGGRSRQVLVLIDGVPVSDPTGINQEYDLRFLSLNQIESVEVLKGAASTLYGSGAATGVINIILKKPSKKDVNFQYETSIGTHASSDDSNFNFTALKQSVGVNGTLKKVDYLAAFNLASIDGLSAAKSQDDSQQFETDPYQSKNGLLKLGIALTSEVKITTFFNYDSFHYSYDAGAYSDSNVNTGNQEQLRFGIKPSYTHKRGELYMLASINSIDRTLNSFNAFANSVNVFGYKGESINLDLVNKYTFADASIQLITGINYQEHNNQTRSDFGNIDRKIANFNTFDPYASVVYVSEFGLNINVGGRLNIHSEYDSEFVYDTNVSYNLLRENKQASLKLLTSYGTAFIAPSAYQLFSEYGNLALTPETNKTIEAGFEASHADWFTMSAVYFNRTEENAIVFKSLATAPWGIYDNTASTIDVNGVETAIRLKPLAELDVNFAYTYTNKDTNSDYIPKHKLVLNVVANPFKNSYFSLVYKAVGERSYYDQYGNFGTLDAEVVLPSYGLIDLNVNYKFATNKVMLFAGVSNLLNESYEETLGYSTRGINYNLGLRFNF